MHPVFSVFLWTFLLVIRDASVHISVAGSAAAGRKLSQSGAFWREIFIEAVQAENAIPKAWPENWKPWKFDIQTLLAWSHWGKTREEGYWTEVGLHEHAWAYFGLVLGGFGLFSILFLLSRIQPVKPQEWRRSRKQGQLSTSCGIN